MDKRLPILIEHTVESSSHLILRMRAQAELEYFNGHFPGTPIVPGVTQVHWAEKLARRFIEDLPAGEYFEKLEAVKFQQLMQPEQIFDLELRYQKEKMRLHFRYYFDDIQFSIGRFVFSRQRTEL